MNIQVDRAIPVPIAAQLKGQIEYGISYGMLEPGSKLPNVRDFAKKLKVSPATVSQVYQDLKRQGIIVSTPGRGTYVSDSLPPQAEDSDRVAALDSSIRHLVMQARDVGLSKADLLHRVSRHLNGVTGNKGAHGLSIAFVGEFLATSGAYLRAIQKYIKHHDHTEAFTFSDLNEQPSAHDVLNRFDLLLTIAHKAGELRKLAPRNASILGVSFIPSETTRTALAKVDPLAKVGLVSTFPEFLAVLKSGVTTYAPHITVSDTAILGTKRAEALSQTCNVIVYASGAEKSVEALDESVVVIEYLHTPDPVYLVQTLAPLLTELRTVSKVTPPTYTA